MGEGEEGIMIRFSPDSNKNLKTKPKSKRLGLLEYSRTRLVLVPNSGIFHSCVGLCRTFFGAGRISPFLEECQIFPEDAGFFFQQILVSSLYFN